MARMAIGGMTSERSGFFQGRLCWTSRIRRVIAHGQQLRQSFFQLLKFGDPLLHMLLVLFQDLRPDVAVCAAVCRRIQQLLDFNQRHVQAAAGAYPSQLLNVLRAVRSVTIV